MSGVTPLRLLSLDGGGVKGLTTLYILQQIMHTIKFKENLESYPQPCDYFDFMGGTSTGGLIAIMLGRLGMDIEECIAKYRSLTKRVFGKKKTVGKLRKLFSATRGSEWFDSAILEQVIKEIVQERCGNEREPLLGDSQPGCRIFVCATPAASDRYQLLRSYINPFVDTHCELWEAARATSAAPLFFEPITFQKSGDVFVDGVLQLNNPVRELVNEADRIWPGVPISCLVSIGTGCVKVGELNPKVHKMIRTVIQMSMHAENAAEAFMKEQRGRSLFDEKRYYRFNVEQGIQEVEMDDCDDGALNRMKQRTTTYVQGTAISVQMEACVARLIHPDSELSVKSRVLVPLELNAALQQDILQILKPVDFTGYLSQMESDWCRDTGDWILTHPDLQGWTLKSSDSPSTIWLYGNPGCGKTFLMFSILNNLMMTKSNNRPNNALLYFFCDKKTKHTARQDPNSILRTLIAQVLLHHLETDQKLVQSTVDSYKKYANEEDGIPLWLLDQTYKRFLGPGGCLPAYILLDGLDECSDWGTLLRYLSPDRLPKAKFLFSSRDMDVLRELIIGDTEDESKTTIEITSDRMYQDIETFINWKIRFSNVKDLGGKETAIGLLIKESKGLFLLAKFRFDLLDKHSPRLGSDLYRAINELPENLNAYYALELNQLNGMEDLHQNLARKLFLWILYAQRALSFDELAEALSVEQGDRGPRQPKAITAKWIDDISGGLVVFRKITGTVELAHETVREFVQKFTWRNSIQSPMLSDSQTAHVECLSTLIIYLSFDDFQSPKEETQASQLESFTLLEYATQYWPNHLHHLTPSPELQKVFDILDTFLQSNQCVSWWVRAQNLSKYGSITLIGSLQTKFQGWTCFITKILQSNNPITLDNIFVELSKRSALATERELGKEHPNTLKRMSNLASIFWNQGRLAEAEELEVQVLEMAKRVLGEEHPDTLTSMSNLASIFWNQGLLAEAEELEVQVLETTKKVLGEEHPDTLTNMSNLASAFRNRGRWAEAEVLEVQVLESRKRVLGEEHPDTLTSMDGLASTFRNQGRWAEAEVLELQVLETRKRVLGEEHPNTLSSISNLALTFRSQGRLAEAEVLELQVLETRKRVLGEEHPNTLSSMNNLASIFWNQGRLAEAEELKVQVLETRKRILGEEHPNTLTSMHNLASTFRDQGRWAEAEVLEVQVLESRKRVLGEEHPDTLTSMSNLASTFCKQGRWVEAEELEVQVLETRKRVLGEEHPDTLTSINNLAHTYHNHGRKGDAIELVNHALNLFTRTLGAQHPSTLTVASNLRIWKAAQG